MTHRNAHGRHITTSEGDEMAVFGILNGLACLIPIAMPQNFEELCLKRGLYPPEAWKTYRTSAKCFQQLIFSLSFSLSILVMQWLYSFEVVKAACYWAMGNPQNSVYVWMSEIEGIFNLIIISVLVCGILASCYSFFRFLKAAIHPPIKLIWRAVLSPLVIIGILGIIVGCYSIH